ncbi:transposase [Fructobacillus tropaeoli]|jgi:transposase|uniref:Transposase InsE and inactivated derivatives (InsE) n=1 Tax=Fructobacillus tropaeoli TaxID=709323 RepID=A0ABM9MYQ9_9LACO|nr:transposase [Fructobacillus tropaeoli]GIC70875.1 transposase [Fructobacillus tropaeoli]CAK1227279.1 Transposase InsE and inactivated derivatives (InsE) [Fructobacillus tropaeoli]CAK1249716.1 Transposase InsE and inactivated derivatives (InsE) [Fructobacillus tropaeoli]
MIKRPRYSKEFKDSIIALYQEGRSSKSLEKEFGMASTTVLKWAHGAQKQMIGDTIHTNNDMKKIKKENDRLREGNDILKRAAVLLAKN